MAEVIQGYEILESERVGNKAFVLAHNPKAPEPYVTWKRRLSDNECYWGHYFTDKSRAERDFNKRVKEEKQYER